mmetsp:Transcript_26210/g.56267  ORF Transcript_26210/g.56267 Transcript_26210/m.56267 type:complete len:421 (-) Transcript_26210:976-2238(-)
MDGGLVSLLGYLPCHWDALHLLLLGILAVEDAVSQEEDAEDAAGARQGTMSLVDQHLDGDTAEIESGTDAEEDTAVRMDDAEADTVAMEDGILDTPDIHTQRQQLQPQASVDSPDTQPMNFEAEARASRASIRWEDTPDDAEDRPQHCYVRCHCCGMNSTAESPVDLQAYLQEHPADADAAELLLLFVLQQHCNNPIHNAEKDGEHDARCIHGAWGHRLPSLLLQQCCRHQLDQQRREVVREETPCPSYSASEVPTHCSPLPRYRSPNYDYYNDPNSARYHRHCSARQSAAARQDDDPTLRQSHLPPIECVLRYRGGSVRGIRRSRASGRSRPPAADDGAGHRRRRRWCRDREHWRERSSDRDSAARAEREAEEEDAALPAERQLWAAVSSSCTASWGNEPPWEPPPFHYYYCWHHHHHQ